MGAGKKSKTRHDISVRGATYDALRARSQQTGESVDNLAERILVRALDRAEVG